MRTIYVVDITLASILDAYGIPKRQFDPVTREVREYNGKDVSSGKWWYDVTDDEINNKAHILMGAYSKARDWDDYQLDIEHPLYWMKGFAENRAANLHLFHHGATEMRVIEKGDRTVYIGPRISKKDKETLKKML
jgi:hypothetical protein